MKVGEKWYRTVWFEDSSIKLIHQPVLPHKFEVRSLNTPDEACIAIAEMWVRGAPAIGATAAYAMVLAVINADDDQFQQQVESAATALKNTRPTAQNLFYGIERIKRVILSETSRGKACKAAIQEAEKMAQEESDACERIGEFGASLLEDGMRVLTHCNAGWLACVDWGTALSPIYKAKRQGKKLTVYVDETRPRSQGARLTAWELGQEGIEHYVIADNAAGHLMATGKIDAVIVGSDRVALNGDVANKIGTMSKAMVASNYQIPFYAALPVSTIDFNCATGEEIPIEERSPDEVHFTWGLNDQGEFVRVRTTPATSTAFNPAFDVTPADYVSKIITELGIHQPDSLHTLPR